MFAVTLGRRAFCRALGLALLFVNGVRAIGAASNNGVRATSAASPRRSRVVSVHDARASSAGKGLDDADLDQDVLREMVNRGVLALTGAKELRQAWCEIIPDPSKKVAIKVNCQIRGIYTKAKVVQPIVEGILSAGVQADHILIYDMTDNAFDLAGFRRNTGPGLKVGKVSDFGGYSRVIYHRLANLLTGGHRYSGLNLAASVLNARGGRWDCDYLINVPVLKALDGYCGVSLGMKNHYGSIADPGEHHKDIMEHIPLINSLPEIRKKTRLVLLDAIFGEYLWQNGRDQRYVTRVNKILASRDPVAIDATGWRMIEKLRKEHGIPPVQPQPVYIAKAAALGLGADDPSRIELVELEAGRDHAGREQ
uniref:DUF362 domain-containing protein n=1 Tax=Geobacter sp. (strain M21) TaxID=443144 RepID=C6DZW1_GEOSM